MEYHLAVNAFSKFLDDFKVNKLFATWSSFQSNNRKKMMHDLKLSLSSRLNFFDLIKN